MLSRHLHPQGLSSLQGSGHHIMTSHSPAKPTLIDVTQHRPHMLARGPQPLSLLQLYSSEAFKSNQCAERSFLPCQQKVAQWAQVQVAACGKLMCIPAPTAFAVLLRRARLLLRW